MTSERRQPDDLTGWLLSGKILFVLLWLGIMALFSIFVLPFVYEYVSLPFGDWVYEAVRQWTGEPPKPPRT